MPKLLPLSESFGLTDITLQDVSRIIFSKVYSIELMSSEMILKKVFYGQIMLRSNANHIPLLEIYNAF